jgi:hypothetical protein
MPTREAPKPKEWGFFVVNYPENRIPGGLMVRPALIAYEESREYCIWLYEKSADEHAAGIGSAQRFIGRLFHPPKKNAAAAREAAISAIQLSGAIVNDDFAAEVAKVIALYSRPTTAKYEYRISRLISEIVSFDPEILKSGLRELARLSDTPARGVGEGISQLGAATSSFRESERQKTEQAELVLGSLINALLRGEVEGVDPIVRTDSAGKEQSGKKAKRAPDIYG